MKTRLQAAAGKETRRFVKFLIVGAGAFVLDTGVLSALVLLLSMHAVLAKGIAFTVAVLASFAGNQLWTYRESRSKPVAKQFVQFASISIVGLGLNLVVFGVVQAATVGVWGAFVALYAAQVAAVGVAMIWNFFANRFITYNDVE